MANYFPDINYELNDLHSVKVLICHLLNSIHKEVSLEELYEIAVGSEIINYFYYNEAIEALLKTGAIEKKVKNGKEVIFITAKGSYGAEELKRCVPKSLRDKIISVALKLFAKQKISNEVDCDIEQTENGFYVDCKIHDVHEDILQMKLYSPTYEQAVFITEKLESNPSEFYGKIISYALNLKEFQPNVE